MKESLKSIILSGESQLDKFVSHRVLYFLGFLTGWDTRIFSLELLPIGYFLIWSIVLFALNEIPFALVFLISGIIIFIYFILLHTVISSWDRIKHWLIRRAQKRGGVKNLTLDDIKYLLIYTRKVFGVKTEVTSKNDKPFHSENLRKMLLHHKNWQKVLTALVFFALIILTGLGIYGVIINANILDWLKDWWYFIPALFSIILVGIIGLVISKAKIRVIINNIPTDKFDEVLRILNDFEVFGGKK